MGEKIKNADGIKNIIMPDVKSVTKFKPHNNRPGISGFQVPKSPELKAKITYPSNL